MVSSGVSFSLYKSVQPFKCRVAGVNTNFINSFFNREFHSCGFLGVSKLYNKKNSDSLINNFCYSGKLNNIFSVKDKNLKYLCWIFKYNLIFLFSIFYKSLFSDSNFHNRRFFMLSRFFFKFLNLNYYKYFFSKKLKYVEFFLNFDFFLKKKNLNIYFTSNSYIIFSNLTLSLLNYYNSVKLNYTTFKKYLYLNFNSILFFKHIQNFKFCNLSQNNYLFKFLKYNFVFGFFTFLFLNNSFLSNLDFFCKFVNFKNNLSIIKINTFNNFKSVLSILNFIFLFIVFIQKIILFLNSYFLDISYRLFDIFRVYVKSSDIFNKITYIFGSDFGLKYYFNNLWSSCLVNINPLLNLNDVFLNYDKDILVPYSYLTDDESLYDKEETRDRNELIFKLNSGVKDFIFNEDNKNLSIKKTLYNKSLGCVSMAYDKKNINFHSFNFVYYFLNTTSTVLPYVLNTLASKSIWGVSGLVNYKNVNFNFFFSKVLYSFNASFKVVNHCLSHKSGVLNQYFKFKIIFFYGFTFGREYYTDCFKAFFNGYRSLSYMKKQTMYSMVYHNYFKNFLDVYMASTNGFTLLKNSSLLPIFEGLFTFKFFAMQRLFSLSKNMGDFFFKFNLPLRYFGKTFEAASQVCTNSFTRRFYEFRPVGLRSCFYKPLHKQAYMDVLKNYHYDFINTGVNHKYNAFRLLGVNFFVSYTYSVEVDDFFRLGIYKGFLKKKDVIFFENRNFSKTLFIPFSKNYKLSVFSNFGKNSFKMLKFFGFNKFVFFFNIVKFFVSRLSSQYIKIFKKFNTLFLFKFSKFKHFYKFSFLKNFIKFSHFNSFLKNWVFRRSFSKNSSFSKSKKFHSMSHIFYIFNTFFKFRSWMLSSCLFFYNFKLIFLKKKSINFLINNSFKYVRFFSQITIRGDVSFSEKVCDNQYKKLLHFYNRSKTLAIFGFNRKNLVYSLRSEFLKNNFLFFGFDFNSKSKTYVYFFNNNYKLYFSNSIKYLNLSNLFFVVFLKNNIKLLKPYYFFNCISWFKKISNFTLKARFSGVSLKFGEIRRITKKVPSLFNTPWLVRNPLFNAFRKKFDRIRLSSKTEVQYKKLRILNSKFLKKLLKKKKRGFIPTSKSLGYTRSRKISIKFNKLAKKQFYLNLDYVDRNFKIEKFSYLPASEFFKSLNRFTKGSSDYFKNYYKNLNTYVRYAFFKRMYRYVTVKAAKYKFKNPNFLSNKRKYFLNLFNILKQNYYETNDNFMLLNATFKNYYVFGDNELRNLQPKFFEKNNNWVLIFKRIKFGRLSWSKPFPIKQTRCLPFEDPNKIIMPSILKKTTFSTENKYAFLIQSGYLFGGEFEDVFLKEKLPFISKDSNTNVFDKVINNSSFSDVSERFRLFYYVLTTNKKVNSLAFEITKKLFGYTLDGKDPLVNFWNIVRQSRRSSTFNSFLKLKYKCKSRFLYSNKKNYLVIKKKFSKLSPQKALTKKSTIIFVKKIILKFIKKLVSYSKVIRAVTKFYFKGRVLPNNSLSFTSIPFDSYDSVQPSFGRYPSLFAYSLYFISNPYDYSGSTVFEPTDGHYFNIFKNFLSKKFSRSLDLVIENSDFAFTGVNPNINIDHFLQNEKYNIIRYRFMNMKTFFYHKRIRRKLIRSIKKKRFFRYFSYQPYMHTRIRRNNKISGLRIFRKYFNLVVSNFSSVENPNVLKHIFNKFYFEFSKIFDKKKVKKNYDNIVNVKKRRYFKKLMEKLNKLPLDTDFPLCVMILNLLKMGFSRRTENLKLFRYFHSFRRMYFSPTNPRVPRRHLRLPRFYLQAYYAKKQRKKYWSKVKRKAFSKSSKVYKYFANSVRGSDKYIKRSRTFNIARIGSRFALLRTPNLFKNFWLRKSLDWPYTGFWSDFSFVFVKRKQKKNKLAFKRIIIQTSSFQKNMNFGPFGYNAIAKFFVRNDKFNLYTSRLQGVISNHINNFFFGSKFFRKSKFVLKVKKPRIFIVKDWLEFSIFNFFKFNSFSILKNNNMDKPLYCKKSFTFKFFKFTYLNRFFFVSYLNSWNKLFNNFFVINFYIYNKSKFFFLNKHANSNFKFLKSFWLKFYNWKFFNEFYKV